MIVLRDALVRKGIHTLEDFKRLNLWVFMNQNRLYSISDRKAVYTAVQRAMAYETAEKHVDHWKIVTLKMSMWVLLLPRHSLSIAVLWLPSTRLGSKAL